MSGSARKVCEAHKRDSNVTRLAARTLNPDAQPSRCPRSAGLARVLETFSQLPGGRSHRVGRRAPRALAHFALLGLAFHLFGACVITSSPEFQDPEKTAPRLAVDLATPDPRAIVFLQPTDVSLPLATYVESEDAGEKLEVRILADYGSQSGTRPFQSVSIPQYIQPGHIEDGPRPVSVTWGDGAQRLDVGCHRLTLIVSHQFGDDGCPIDENDYDALTWLVVRCGSGGCPDLSDPATTCPSIAYSCRNKPPAGEP